VAVVAIAGQARQIVNQRIPRLGQTIEQGGLADIGSADQDEGGFHRERDSWAGRERRAAVKRVWSRIYVTHAIRGLEGIDWQTRFERNHDAVDRTAIAGGAGGEMHRLRH
jgi:hypothetical protein